VFRIDSQPIPLVLYHLHEVHFLVGLQPTCPLLLREADLEVSVQTYLPTQYISGGVLEWLSQSWLHLGAELVEQAYEWLRGVVDTEFTEQHMGYGATLRREWCWRVYLEQWSSVLQAL